MDYNECLGQFVYHCGNLELGQQVEGANRWIFQFLSSPYSATIAVALLTASDDTIGYPKSIALHVLLALLKNQIWVGENLSMLPTIKETVFGLYSNLNSSKFLPKRGVCQLLSTLIAANILLRQQHQQPSPQQFFQQLQQVTTDHLMMLYVIEDLPTALLAMQSVDTSASAKNSNSFISSNSSSSSNSNSNNSALNLTIVSDYLSFLQNCFLFVKNSIYSSSEGTTFHSISSNIAIVQQILKCYLNWGRLAYTNASERERMLLQHERNGIVIHLFMTQQFVIELIHFLLYNILLLERRKQLQTQIGTANEAIEDVIKLILELLTEYAQETVSLNNSNITSESEFQLRLNTLCSIILIVVYLWKWIEQQKLNRFQAVDVESINALELYLSEMSSIIVEFHWALMLDGNLNNSYYCEARQSSRKIIAELLQSLRVTVAPSTTTATTAATTSASDGLSALFQYSLLLTQQQQQHQQQQQQQQLLCTSMGFEYCTLYVSAIASIDLSSAILCVEQLCYCHEKLAKIQLLVTQSPTAELKVVLGTFVLPELAKQIIPILMQKIRIQSTISLRCWFAVLRRAQSIAAYGQQQQRQLGQLGEDEDNHNSNTNNEDDNEHNLEVDVDAEERATACALSLLEIDPMEYCSSLMSFRCEVGLLFKSMLLSWPSAEELLMEQIAQVLLQRLQSLSMNTSSMIDLATSYEVDALYFVLVSIIESVCETMHSFADSADSPSKFVKASTAAIGLSSTARKPMQLSARQLSNLRWLHVTVEVMNLTGSVPDLVQRCPLVAIRFFELCNVLSESLGLSDTECYYSAFMEPLTNCLLASLPMMCSCLQLQQQHQQQQQQVYHAHPILRVAVIKCLLSMLNYNQVQSHITIDQKLVICEVLFKSIKYPASSSSAAVSVDRLMIDSSYFPKVCKCLGELVCSIIIEPSSVAPFAANALQQQLQQQVKLLLEYIIRQFSSEFAQLSDQYLKALHSQSTRNCCLVLVVSRNCVNGLKYFFESLLGRLPTKRSSSNRNSLNERLSDVEGGDLLVGSEQQQQHQQLLQLTTPSVQSMTSSTADGEGSDDWYISPNCLLLRSICSSINLQLLSFTTSYLMAYQQLSHTSQNYQIENRLNAFIYSIASLQSCLIDWGLTRADWSQFMKQLMELIHSVAFPVSAVPLLLRSLLTCELLFTLVTAEDSSVTTTHSTECNMLVSSIIACCDRCVAFIGNFFVNCQRQQQSDYIEALFMNCAELFKLLGSLANGRFIHLLAHVPSSVAVGAISSLSVASTTVIANTNKSLCFSICSVLIESMKLVSFCSNFLLSSQEKAPSSRSIAPATLTKLMRRIGLFWNTFCQSLCIGSLHMANPSFSNLSSSMLTPVVSSSLSFGAVCSGNCLCNCLCTCADRNSSHENKTEYEIGSEHETMSPRKSVRRVFSNETERELFVLIQQIFSNSIDVDSNGGSSIIGTVFTHLILHTFFSCDTKHLIIYSGMIEGMISLLLQIGTAQQHLQLNQLFMFVLRKSFDQLANLLQHVTQQPQQQQQSFSLDASAREFINDLGLANVMNMIYLTLHHHTLRLYTGQQTNQQSIELNMIIRKIGMLTRKSSKVRQNDPIIIWNS